MTFDEIFQLQKNGQAEEAKVAYLAFLQHHPDHAQAWHMLGISYAEEGSFNEAIHALEKALKIDTQNPTIHLHLANVFKAQGNLDFAEKTLTGLVKQFPKFPAAFNNLGTIYYAKQEWQLAIDAYQKAIDFQPNFVDAYYNLGLAYGKNSQLQEAITVYLSILELSAKHAGAMFQLATIYMGQEKYTEALKLLLEIERDYPFHFETQSNLGACYLHLGNLTQAKSHYQKASDIEPADLQVLFNLGVIEMQQSNMQSACDYYLKALAVNVDFVEAHNNLAIVYLGLKNRAGALKHFTEVLRLHGNNVAVQHTIDILNHKTNVDHSPPEYIQSLFDSYADHYDSHLLGPLAYQVPALLHEAAKKHLPAHPLAILDLGAGTGLSGDIFRSHANKLIGVDLSEKMLAVAAQKRIYDELVQDDIVSYLNKTKAHFDLVLAADVVVYFGDLATMFCGVSKILNPAGLFVFNTEISDSVDYKLTVTGRFAHNKAYVELVASENGLSVLSDTISVLRKHQDEEVKGYIFILKKQT